MCFVVNYDKIGNLIADKSEGIEKIEWTVYGKVARVVRKAKITPTTPASTNLLENYDDVIIDYSYDAMGNRISKTVRRREGLDYKELGFGTGDFLGTEKTTYYVRDAQGNVLSIYDQGAYFKYSTGTPANPWLITAITGNVPARRVAPPINPPTFMPNLPLALSEQIIYGSARIGAYKPQRNQKISPTNVNRGKIIPILAGQLTLGYKSYELSNHLGNVLTTISDNKMMVQTTSTTGTVLEVYLQAVVLTTQDYYPFGKGMSERSYVNVDRNAQRYGFNGKELESDDGEGIYNFEARMMNVNTGRFTSVDPLAGKYPSISAYVFVMGNPISFIDPTGMFVDDIYYNQEGEETHRTENSEPDRHFMQHSEGNYISKESKYVQVNSRESIIGDRRETSGWQAGGLNNSFTTEQLQNIVKNGLKEMYEKNYGLPNIIKESGRGGSIDFKDEFKAGELINIQGIYYNNHEALNYLWGAAMQIVGFEAETAATGAYLFHAYDNFRFNTIFPFIHDNPRQVSLMNETEHNRAIIMGYHNLFNNDNAAPIKSFNVKDKTSDAQK